MKNQLLPACNLLRWKFWLIHAQVTRRSLSRIKQRKKVSDCAWQIKHEKTRTPLALKREGYRLEVTFWSIAFCCI
jgi:hypothetical protein